MVKSEASVSIRVGCPIRKVQSTGGFAHDYFKISNARCWSVVQLNFFLWHLLKVLLFWNIFQWIVCWSLRILIFLYVFDVFWHRPFQYGFNFFGFIWMPSVLTMNPKNSTFFLWNSHFSGFKNNAACDKQINFFCTCWTWCFCSSE